MKTDFQAQIEERNAQISELNSEVKSLKDKVRSLEKNADDADAYERRDTLIFNGPSIPTPNQQENCSTIVQDLVKNQLKLNISILFCRIVSCDILNYEIFYNIRFFIC